MSSFPVYTPEENVTRVQMESGVNFVVVEGVDDAPIYESVLHSILPDGDIDVWDVVHVGGKTNIKDLIAQCNSNNYICIADKDFDEKIDATNVVNLSRYSIENFLICEEAISAVLSIALKKKYQDVLADFDLDEFYHETEERAKKLLVALFYYQRVIGPSITGERQSWSDTVIHMYPPTWGLCTDSIEGLINRLIPADVEEADMNAFFDGNFESSGVVAHDLPGKMLKVLLQRYVSRYYKNIKKGGIQFNSPDSCMATIASKLNCSSDFVSLMEPVLSFLRPMQTA